MNPRKPPARIRQLSDSVAGGDRMIGFDRAEVVLCQMDGTD